MALVRITTGRYDAVCNALMFGLLLVVVAEDFQVFFDATFSKIIFNAFSEKEFVSPTIHSSYSFHRFENGFGPVYRLDLRQPTVEALVVKGEKRAQCPM